MRRSSRFHNHNNVHMLQNSDASFIGAQQHHHPSAATMPPLHLHTTVYAPVVSPPTPAPSPGPVQTFDLLPSPGSSPTSSENYEHETTNSERSPVVRRQFLSSLLASCTPEELLFISATIAPRLKRDFLFCLPTELALYILGFIEDPRTLARAEQVSRHWRTLVNEESVWKKMCEMHGFDDWNNNDEPFEEEPLEEMEQFANFPMDPALEWLITKRRQEIGDRKGKAKEATPSYRSHFRNCYITMTNWRKGGHLLRSHRIPIVTTESETVTSLALDPDWVVIGLANSRIQVYSAKTGVLAKTLIGHESGVWSLSLVSKGGWMAPQPTPPAAANLTPGSSPSSSSSFSDRDPLPPPLPFHSSSGRGSRRTSTPRGARSLARLSLDNSPLPRIRPATSSSRSVPGSSLEHLVPASLRIAIGLDPSPELENDGEETMGPAFPCAASTSSDSRSEDNDSAGILDEDVMEEDLERLRRDADRRRQQAGGGGHASDFSFPYASASSSSRRSGSTGRRHSAFPNKQHQQSKRKYSDMCYSSTGWGQPNSIVVSGGCDKVIMVWDVKTGHCIYRLSGHTSTIRCIRVLQNRPIAVSGSRDSTLRVWDIQRGRCLRVLQGHQSSVRCIDVCGNRVVSGSYDTTCRVWDVDTGECLHVLQGHFQQIYSVAFDGKYIASGGLDTTVRLWDADTGNCVALLQGHTALVCQLQLSPTLLITGGSDGRVITFSLETLSISHRIAAHDCSVTSLQFVDDGGSRDNFLVTGGNDGRVRLYEVQTGNYVRDVSEGGEGIWRVVVGWGVCVVVCKRGGKSVVEIWSMRPEGSGSAGCGAITATPMSSIASGSGGFGLSGAGAICSISATGSGHPVASEIPLADLLREEEVWRRRSDDGEDQEPARVRRAASG